MFDRYAAATAPSWGRRALAIASIALHVAAALALAIYSIMHVEEIAPPAVSLTFFAAPPPPPPPPAGHHKKTQTTKPKPTVIIPTHAMQIVQPKVEEKPEEKDEPDEPDGVEGGVAGGVKGGVVGGVVGSTGKVPSGGGKMVPMFTLMASRISNTLPHLPDFFMSAHAHSTINASYKICLKQDGHVESVEPKMSLAGNVDQMVMDQIKAGWLYKPQPLPVCFVQPFKFQIN